MKKFIKIGVVLAVVLAGYVPVTFAQPIKERQAAMKGVGESTKALSAVVTGKRAFIGELVERHGQRILDSFIKAQKLFNNGVETKGSTAKSTIWSNPAEFARIFEGGIAGARAAAAAGANSDPAALKAAFGQLAKSCKSCHESFRLPKEW